MTKRILVAAAAAAMLQGCVKEITSDERLERETQRSESMKSSTAAELGRLKCDDVTGELIKARDDKRSEEDRIQTYIDLYEKVKTRTQRFDEAMSRNPDLAYQDGSQELVSAREACIQASADVRLELESLVREIMQLLIVDDVQSGTPVKVARLNYEPLKAAIEKLELDDKDALLTKVANAAKQVDVKPTPRKR
jgi:hypothetical protein